MLPAGCEADGCEADWTALDTAATAGEERTAPVTPTAETGASAAAFEVSIGLHTARAASAIDADIRRTTWCRPKIPVDCAWANLCVPLQVVAFPISRKRKRNVANPSTNWRIRGRTTWSCGWSSNLRAAAGASLTASAKRRRAGVFERTKPPRRDRSPSNRLVGALQERAVGTIYPLAGISARHRIRRLWTGRSHPQQHTS